MFCDELRAFRQSLGLTAAEMGKRLGISAAGVSRYENFGKTKSYIKYTRRLNKEFGANFPDMSCCKVCGEEFLGNGSICKECAVNNAPKVKRQESLLTIAQKAEKAGLSYGELVAGRAPKERIRTCEPPKWLRLGKTVKI